jgi:hypothetical protein
MESDDFKQMFKSYVTGNIAGVDDVVTSWHGTHVEMAGRMGVFSEI